MIAKGSRLPMKWCIAFVVLFGGLEFVEMYGLWRTGSIVLNDNFYMLIPTSYFLFQLCLNLKVNLPGKFASFMRKSSIIYYLLQFILISIFTRILYIGNGLVVFALVLACVSAASFLIIKKSEQYPWLKNLY